MNGIPKDSVASLRFFGLILISSMFWSGAVQAQSPTQLDRLIFAAVPLTENTDPPPPVLSRREPPSVQLTSLETSLDNLPPRLNSPDDTIAHYQAAIRRHETEAGPYSADLQQDLLALGKLYQSQGEHELALEYFERAGHISRINYGLHSLQQTDAVENSIDSLIASGRMTQADDKQRYLVYLHEKYYGVEDVHVVPALQRFAAWSMNAFQRGIRYQASSAFDISFNSERYGNEDEVRKRAFMKLFEAQTTYLRAINNLLANQLFSDPRLLELEHGLIETYYLQSRQNIILHDPAAYLTARSSVSGSLRQQRGQYGSSTGFRAGIAAYTRILSYLQHNPAASAEQYVQHLLALGDWHLLYGRKNDGIKEYRKTLDFLRTAKIAEEEIQTLLRPPMPVLLPSFTATPHSFEMMSVTPQEDLSFTGYIDLSIRLNEFGKASKIELLGKSPDTSKAVEGRLFHVVRQNQYRPRLKGTDFAEEDTVSLRYYYTFHNYGGD